MQIVSGRKRSPVNCLVGGKSGDSKEYSLVSKEDLFLRPETSRKYSEQLLALIIGDQPVSLRGVSLITFVSKTLPSLSSTAKEEVNLPRMNKFLPILLGGYAVSAHPHIPVEFVKVHFDPGFSM